MAQQYFKYKLGVTLLLSGITLFPISSMADRVSHFNVEGHSGTVRHVGIADKLNKIKGPKKAIKVDCSASASAVSQAKQRASIRQQNAVNTVMGSINFNPMVNCQAMAGKAAEQIMASGGMTGFAGQLFSQLSSSAACSFGPISRGINTYNQAAGSAMNIANGVKSGNASQVVSGGMGLGAQSGMISGQAASTIGQSVIGGAQTYQGYQSGNIAQAVQGVTQAGTANGVISYSTGNVVNNGGTIYQGVKTGNVSQAVNGSQGVINAGSRYLTGKR